MRWRVVINDLSLEFKVAQWNEKNIFITGLYKHTHTQNSKGKPDQFS